VLAKTDPATGDRGARQGEGRNEPATNNQNEHSAQDGRGNPNTLPATKSTVRGLSGRQTAERSDHYRDVVAVLNHGLRVIRCKGGIQWIIQARVGGHWRAFWHCRTKTALLRGAGQYASHPALATLPERIGGVP